MKTSPGCSRILRKCLEMRRCLHRSRGASTLQLELPNTPGALGKVARKLAEEDINITLGYATSEKGSKRTCVVLAVSDLDKAAIIR
jgi:hypothetical protein